MKKIYAFIVVAAAAAMVSCAGNAKKPAAVEVETAEVATEQVEKCCGECPDSLKKDSCCQEEACCKAAAAEVVETEAAK